VYEIILLVRKKLELAGVAYKKKTRIKTKELKKYHKANFGKDDTI